RCKQVTIRRMEAFDVRSLLGKSSQEVDSMIERLRLAGALPVGFPTEPYSSQSREGRVRMLARLQKGASQPACSSFTITLICCELRLQVLSPSRPRVSNLRLSLKAMMMMILIRPRHVLPWRSRQKLAGRKTTQQGS